MKKSQNNKVSIAIIAIIITTVLLSSSLVYNIYRKKNIDPTYSPTPPQQTTAKNSDTDPIYTPAPLPESTVESSDIITKIKTLITRETTFNKYKADSSYENISFEYPDSYPVTTDLEERPDQGIGLEKFDTKLEPEGGRVLIESMQKYYNGLVNSNFVGKSPFSVWSNDKVQIKKTKSGKPFGVSTTFVAYDFCTLVFHTDISIPKNNNIVEITIYGNTEKIRDSLDDGSMMLIYKDGCFTEDGINKLSELLTTGQGTPEVRDWYDTANHVINTLEY